MIEHTHLKKLTEFSFLPHPSPPFIIVKRRTLFRGRRRREDERIPVSFFFFLTYMCSGFVCFFVFLVCFSMSLTSGISFLDFVLLVIIFSKDNYSLFLTLKYPPSPPLIIRKAHMKLEIWPVLLTFFKKNCLPNLFTWLKIKSMKIFHVKFNYCFINGDLRNFNVLILQCCYKWCSDNLV